MITKTKIFNYILKMKILSEAIESYLHDLDSIQSTDEAMIIIDNIEKMYSFQLVAHKENIQKLIKILANAISHTFTRLTTKQKEQLRSVLQDMLEEEKKSPPEVPFANDFDNILFHSIRTNFEVNIKIVLSDLDRLNLEQSLKYADTVKEVRSRLTSDNQSGLVDFLEGKIGVKYISVRSNKLSLDDEENLNVFNLITGLVTNLEKSTLDSGLTLPVCEYYELCDNVYTRQHVDIQWNMNECLKKHGWDGHQFKTACNRKALIFQLQAILMKYF